MSTLITIDVSKSKYTSEDDLIKITLKDGNNIEVNFSKLISLSKYFRDKYKFSEAVELIPEEISKIEENMQINIDRIISFIKLIQDEKVEIPLEWYNDFYTLSEHFIIPKFIKELNDISEQEINININFAIQILTSEKLKPNLEMRLAIKFEDILSKRIDECLENENFKKLPIEIIYRIVEKGKENVKQDLLIDFIFESLLSRLLLIKIVKFDKLNDDKFEQFKNLKKKIIQTK